MYRVQTSLRCHCSLDCLFLQQKLVCTNNLQSVLRDASVRTMLPMTPSLDPATAPLAGLVRSVTEVSCNFPKSVWHPFQLYIEFLRKWLFRCVNLFLPYLRLILCNESLTFTMQWTLQTSSLISLSGCTPGTWGTDCLQNCTCLTEHQSSPCDVVNGTCHCLPGYTGIECQQSK